MNWKQIAKWLQQTAPPDDVEKQAEALIKNLQREQIVLRRGADQVLARIGYSWDAYYTAEFVLAVLRRLKDAQLIETIPVVEQLVEYRTRAHAQPRIKAAAVACLEELYAHAKVVEERRTLLRPAQSGAGAPEDLLRPAEERVSGTARALTDEGANETES